MTLDFMGDGSDFVGTIAEFDSLRTQLKSRKYDALLTFCCFFSCPSGLRLLF